MTRGCLSHDVERRDGTDIVAISDKLHQRGLMKPLTRPKEIQNPDPGENSKVT